RIAEAHLREPVGNCHRARYGIRQGHRPPRHRAASGQDPQRGFDGSGAERSESHRSLFGPLAISMELPRAGTFHRNSIAGELVMLKVENLAVSYGQSQIIRDLSFEARPKETLAIMGRNGMGKTTLFKALIGVLPSKGGKVSVADKEVSGMPSYKRVENGIAYVPQGRLIFPTLTVLENIETGLETAKAKTVSDDIYALFPVLFDMRKRKGGNLSGGQQQQLAIARALASEPKVLLLDEPTEGI